ncbi:MAG: glycerophosphodiester phosphodiesterase [Acidobacteria bacterium]|nr:glycerophosphodiester phosphodiesterase [Acidobacteriota bacterium]
MIGLVFRVFGYFLGFSALGLGGLYGYVSFQAGVPASGKEFFRTQPNRPLVIAHRGGGGQFPENTLYAFEESAKLGVDILELDVHETADGELVVLHDRKVNRTTDGDGEIRAMTLEQSQKLDAAFDFSTDGGTTFPMRGKGVRIPTLKEVFAALPDNRFNIEMKPESETISTKLCAIVRERGLAERVIVASTSRTNLDNFRAACPEVATSGSFSEVTKFLVYQKTGLGESYSPAMNAIQTPVRLRNFDFVTADYIEKAHKLNLQIHVWTINDPGEMKRLIDLGVDGIMTDYPERLLSLRK